MQDCNQEEEINIIVSFPGAFIGKLLHITRKPRRASDEEFSLRKAIDENNSILICGVFYLLMEAFHSIRRVVSGEDMFRGQLTEVMSEGDQHMADNDLQQDRSDWNPGDSEAQSGVEGTAHLVEPEMSNTAQHHQQQQLQQNNALSFDPMEGIEEEEEGAPLRIIIEGRPLLSASGGAGAGGGSMYNDSSSSLSTDGDGGREHLVTLQQEAPPKIRRMGGGGLQRMNSSGGGDSVSTNSQRAHSNNSGDWFFGDLHLDENGNPIRQSSEQLKDNIKSSDNGESIAAKCDSID